MTAISKLTGGLNAAFNAMTNTPLKKYSLAVTSALLALGSLRLTWEGVKLLELAHELAIEDSPGLTLRRFRDPYPNDPGYIHNRIVTAISAISTVFFLALCVSALRR